MNRHGAVLVRQGINVHLVGHHESGIEAQTKMSDDLILVGFVLILLQELRSSGKRDLRDVLFHLIGGHTDTVIDELQRFLVRIHNHFDLALVILRKRILAHDLQLFQLCDGVAAVGHHLTDKDIVIGIKPLLYDRKNVFTVNRKTAMFLTHGHSHSFDFFI